MKQTLGLVLISLATLTAHAKPALHLDPEMTAEEYQSIFKTLEKNHRMQKLNASDPLVAILALGKRNLEWVEVINSKRDASHKLQLTSAATAPAYPIDQPGYSNRHIILGKLDTLKQTMPSEMADVIFGTGTLPDMAPVEDKTFIAYSYAMKRIYESASRWLLQEPYLSEYASNMQYDIRGYYYLNNEADLLDKLNKWSALDAPTQTKYSDWLVSECNNTTGDIPECRAFLMTAIKNKALVNFHKKYVTNAAVAFNSLFELVNPRPEMIWNHKNPDVMEMPFTQPDRQDVQDWFKANVEDEFHLNSWTLSINYSNRPHLAKIVFVPGVTPHVNGLGGDTITMDANRTLQDYEVSWTIRHEFGHVLGLPDCYVEFYDTAKAVMINYQIDITNIMCSRRGHLQAKHYEQLKKHYYQG